ncbi:toll/interleukin-1 receptor domain-containing protein [Phytopseudomonas daroniae]|nr:MULTISPECIES: toll/interleukin-1 receptor domain-containing protein [Pseudomonas]
MVAPKVFVSHASEDKDRFVIEFAKRLRANGVDAWVDKWEIQVGDSLVERIFQEGLKESRAVIIVLSKFSVVKPWVREELDAAVVNKINKQARIIPVVLDDCEVPQVLQATKWVSCKNLENYDDAFNEIVATIFGASEKPALGSPPPYVASFGVGVGGHNNVDSLVIKLACEAALNSGTPIVGEAAFKEGGEFVLPLQQLKDSIEYLTEHGTIEWSRDLSGSLHGVSISQAGFELYARQHVPDYAGLARKAISLIVNEEVASNVELQGKLGIKRFLVDHILRTLKSSGKLQVTWFLGGQCSIDHVSASLRRSLD